MTHQITNWRKPSASENASNCVEAGWTQDVYAIRDTKQASLGDGHERPTLLVTRQAASSFIQLVSGMTS